MTFLPRTLTGRTILVLLAGLVVSNLVGLLIYASERDTALTSVAGVTVAGRIAAVVQTLERTPPAARADAVCSQVGSDFAVTLTPEAAVDSGPESGGGGGWRARLLRSSIRELLDDPAPERLRIANDDSPTQTTFADVMAQCMGPMMRTMGMQGMQDMPMTPRMEHMMQAGRSGEFLRVSYRLDDDRWLNFMTIAPRFDSIWQSRFFLAFFVMAVVVTVLSVWAVRRSTAPLALFAWAAERLGRDVNAPDLPEDGPFEVHRAAKAFNEMQRRLRRQISDRTQMLAAISHDLRTPITRLRLRAEFVDDDEQRGKMLSDLEQMEAMIAATLAFAREDSTDEPRRILDLAVLVQSVCDNAADVGHDVIYTGPERASYSGRPLALGRVFANLIDNAVKYGERARVALDAEPARFVVTVEDDGPGIPESEFEHVFEPFYRIEASRNRETGGTGLGLAVVRSIVRGHGGDVTLANRAEGGLRATIVLART
jgi:signal transduction histidine kinase